MGEEIVPLFDSRLIGRAGLNCCNSKTKRQMTKNKKQIIINFLNFNFQNILMPTFGDFAVGIPVGEFSFSNLFVICVLYFVILCLKA